MGNGLIGGFGSFGQAQGQQQGNLLGGLFQEQPTRGQIRAGLLRDTIQQFGGNAQQTGGAAIGAGLGMGISKLLGRDVPGAERADKIRRVQEQVNQEEGVDFAGNPSQAFMRVAELFQNEGMQGEAVQAMMQAREFAPESVATEIVVSGDNEIGQNLGLGPDETAIATVENGNVTGLKDRTQQDSPQIASKIREYQQALQLGFIPEGTTFDQFRTATVPGTGPQVGSIPPGMQMITDPETGAVSMQPIPGGLAEQEMEDTEREREVSDKAIARASGIIVDDFNFLLDSLGVDPETGEKIADSSVGGPRVRMATEEGTLGMGVFSAGRPTGDFLRQLESVQNTIAVDQLLEIKRQGSGLGQVPQSQLRTLSTLLGSMDAGLSDEKMAENIFRAKGIYKNIVETSLRDINDPTFRGLIEDMTGGTTGAPAGDQTQPVIEWSDL